MRHLRQALVMRWRMVAFISLATNLALVAGWLLASRSHHGKAAPSEDQITALNVAQTNIVVRRQPFSWREVESPDYPTYIANLRFIGCPEQTIRDIIIADVNAVYARRRAVELQTPEQQWWRSEPDPELLRTAQVKAESLEEERRNLLVNLLGPNWEGGDLASLPRPSRPGIALDGPVLSALAPDTKNAVQEINARVQERVEEYLQEQARLGLRPDPVELARMRQQMRDELARVLTAPELEEYLLRHSQTAMELRNEFGALRFFNPSPDEFRAVFRATDALDQRITSISGTDPNSILARKSLEDQREQALRLALGPRRYDEYRRLQDPAYREAAQTAIESGDPDAAEMIYMANLAAEQEHGAITNSAMTESQKTLAQRQLELERLTANTLATGQQALPSAGPPMPPTPRRTYTVRPGDTAGVISLIHGIPVNALRQANPNINLRRLRTGETLVVPPTTFPPFAAP